MAKVTLGGTINIQGTKKISRTNLAQLREPAITTRLTVAALSTNRPDDIKSGPNLVSDRFFDFSQKKFRALVLLFNCSWPHFSPSASFWMRLGARERSIKKLGAREKVEKFITNDISATMELAP